MHIQGFDSDEFLDLDQCAEAVSWAVERGHLDLADALMGVARVVQSHDFDHAEYVLSEARDRAAQDAAQSSDPCIAVLDYAHNATGPTRARSGCSRDNGHLGLHDFTRLMV